MDDLNGDLWGEEDIDEAMLIEASQQVEDEAFKNVRRSTVPDRSTVKIDDNELALLIQDGNEDVMNSKSGSGPSGISGSNVSRAPGSMTTADVVTKMDPEPSPPPRIRQRIEPVNGIVQPPVYPPPNRPGRVTNQLDYLKTTIKAMLKHPDSSLFLKPVDTVKLGLLDYHKVIPYPMDLGTIKERLDNNYYWCASECLEDVNLIFSNCYMYNKASQYITRKANSLEKFFLEKVMTMPPVEVDMTQQVKCDSNNCCCNNCLLQQLYPRELK